MLDPLERAHENSGLWTYDEAKDAAADSVNQVLGVSKDSVKSEVDSYYQPPPRTLRAGEHTVWPEFRQRRSKRKLADGHGDNNKKLKR